MKQPILYLIRGLPGVGKTTLAWALLGDDKVNVVISADDYFTLFCDGKFMPHKLSQAHEWARNTARQYLENGHSVAVANTFTQEWEIGKYLDMSCPKVVITMEGIDLPWKSVHNVPDETIEKMEKRFYHGSFK